MDLKELPLFNNDKVSIKSDYDFTKSLTFDLVNTSFTLNKERIDELLSYCKKNNIDINHCVESIFKHYLDKK